MSTMFVGGFELIVSVSMLCSVRSVEPSHYAISLLHVILLLVPATPMWRRSTRRRYRCRSTARQPAPHHPASWLFCRAGRSLTNGQLVLNDDGCCCRACQRLDVLPATLRCAVVSPACSPSIITDADREAFEPAVEPSRDWRAGRPRWWYARRPDQPARLMCPDVTLLTATRRVR